MPEVEEKPRKRMGRPPKAPEKGRRQNYTFRLSDQTRDQLIDAAADSGRSMSEEIELRIEGSFRDKQLDLLAQSLLNGSENLYSLISRVSGLISTIENYKDKSGSSLGSKDWAAHEPTRAAIRAGLKVLIDDVVPPSRIFDLDEIAAKKKELFARINKNNKASDEDKALLEEFRDLDNIQLMEVLGKIFAGILGGSVSLRELQSAVLPPM